MEYQRQKLLIVTNLYPLPWEPNRASFNRQQFEHLKKTFDIALIIPVAFADYFKHRKVIVNTDKIRYVPSFYIPKIGRRFNGHYMYHSIMATSSRWIKTFAPDKVLGSWVFPEGLAVQKIAKKLNIPYFIKAHGSDVNAHADNPVRSKIIKQVANNSSGVLSVSQALASKMIDMGVEGKKIHVIYNGVDKAMFTPTTPNEDLTGQSYSRTITFIGNLKKEKGVHELLSAFGKIKAEHLDLKLSFIGNGPEESTLKLKAESMGIADSVRFLGSISHDKLPQIMCNSTLIALPSYAEGVPNVVLESISCGTPVVVTNVGGIPEVVCDGMNGFIAQPKNVESLHKAFSCALSHTWDKEMIQLSSELFCWETNRVAFAAMLNCVTVKKQQMIDSADIVNNISPITINARNGAFGGQPKTVVNG
ncbi:MAG: glycosyltransferase involved in cell wall biosynthesis [Paraglaciecola sp.]|jgi:glycosyltransferase involved in cell wall biosynthesis